MKIPVITLKTQLYGLLLGVSASAFGSTVYDVATNFNAPNNGAASSVFSYGVGGTPGAFAGIASTTLNCVGTPTYCFDSASFPADSQATWNGTAGTLSYATIVQPNTMVRLDPQASAGTILRFTAPFSGSFAVSGLFQGIDTGQQPVNTLVFADGVQQGSTGLISSYGASSNFSFNSALTGGQTIDFIVVRVESLYNLSTGLQATITGTPADGAPVPEPATLGLMLLSLPALALIRRYRS